ncbi:MAG TPA: hypothetical protein VJH63_02450 [Candidatus Paceibacterota bacterium]
MKKKITIYYCDVKEKDWNLLQLLQWISKEFPGVSFEKITPTLGISITLEAEMPEKKK